MSSAPGLGFPLGHDPEAGFDIHDSEIRRIEAEYERRERELDTDTYSPTRPENVFIRQTVERALLRALRDAGLLPLDGRRVLEVGCGTGQWLAELAGWGAGERLAGIDLIPERIERSRRRVPEADLRVGSASSLPWEDAGFDLVLQSMLLSSVLDDDVRGRVCAEIDRVLAPGGIVVSYDFFVDNPFNRAVRGLGRRELKRLFPGYELSWRRVLLAPPLIRALAPRAWWLASVLQSTRALDTHALVVLRRC